MVKTVVALTRSPHPAGPLLTLALGLTSTDRLPKQSPGRVLGDLPIVKHAGQAILRPSNSCRRKTPIRCLWKG